MVLQQQLSTYPKKLVDEEGFPLANVDVRDPTAQPLSAIFHAMNLARFTWFGACATSLLFFKPITSRYRSPNSESQRTFLFG
jgi:hypothetical protein